MKNVLKIIIIGIICFLVSKYIFSLCVVHGNSMSPTLKDKQIVFEIKIVNKINYNDIVVIKKGNLKIIKRVVGKPKDKLIIKDNYLYVNDKKYNDIFINDAGNLRNLLILNDNEYFVLGDNINNSIDSRDNKIGVIKINEIKGKIIKWLILLFYKIKMCYYIVVS